MPLSVLGCLHSPSVDQIHQFSPVLTTVQPAPANCLKSSTLFLRPLWYDNHSSRKSPRSAILLLERLLKETLFSKKLKHRGIRQGGTACRALSPEWRTRQRLPSCIGEQTMNIVPLNVKKRLPLPMSLCKRPRLLHSPF